MRHLSEVSSPGDWQRHGFDLSSLVFYSLSRIHLLRHLSIRFAFPVFSSGGSWQSIMKREFWCLFSRHRLLVVVHWRRGEREENSVKGARRENENVYKRKREKKLVEKKRKSCITLGRFRRRIFYQGFFPLTPRRRQGARAVAATSPIAGFPASESISSSSSATK